MRAHDGEVVGRTRPLLPPSDHDPAPSGRRPAVLATKHGKDRIITPALAGVGLDVHTISCDTDQLGTFSGEIPRPGPPLQTAVRKARLGMELAGCNLGIASEGAFGPDPVLAAFVRDVELVVLVDDTTGSTIVGRATSLTTRSFATVARPDDDLTPLLDGADLPRHAVIVRPNLGPPRPVFKDLRSLAEVAAVLPDCAAASPDGHARIETDLRADRCPSRASVIEAAARDLATRLATHCPACAAVGFGPEETLPGLPCGWCATPTHAARAVREACPRCNHEVERPIDPGTSVADPAQCPRCNP